MLACLAEEVMNLKNNEYLYWKTATGQLSTYIMKLADSKEGATVAIFILD